MLQHGVKPAVRKACSLHITRQAAAFLEGILLGRDLARDHTCLVLSAWREDGEIRYAMRLDEAAADELLRLTVQGIEVAVEPASIGLLDGAEIGFVDGAITIANPNALRSAGELTA